jgi:sugar/nucleoside kinase (ribokinase family)
VTDFDVYAYGVVSSSTLHLLSQPFPAPDAYAEITHTYVMTGGEAANSSIVLSRLGQRVFLDGNWIGDTPEGQILLGILQQFGIDITRLRIKKGYPGVKEIVFSDQASRTIFGNYGDLLFTTRKWNIPRKADIARARLVCVDPPFYDETLQVSRYARQLGIPYVTLDCPYRQELADNAAVVIISGEFRDRQYPGADLADLFQEYQSQASGLVVLTHGGEDLLYGRKGSARQRLSPYLVKVIDSAGAGDTFRAGVAFGLLQGWRDVDTLRYASALAAIICTTFPGVLRCPTHRQVLDFIRQRRPSQDRAAD